MLPLEDVWDAIHVVHKAVGHKGRDIMGRHARKCYLNLTDKLIDSKLFLFSLFYLIERSTPSVIFAMENLQNKVLLGIEILTRQKTKLLIKKAKLPNIFNFLRKIKKQDFIN